MSESGLLTSLRELTEDLRQLNAPYALVGGLAVTVHSEPRFTRDVDLCVAIDSDALAEKLLFELRSTGYEITATVEHADVDRLSIARLRSPRGIICDLLLASNGIESEVVQRATTLDIGGDMQIPVARPEELVAMKVLSSGPKRPQDASDIQRLFEYTPLLSRDTVADNLLLITERGYNRGQALQTKFTALISQFSQSSKTSLE